MKIKVIDQGAYDEINAKMEPVYDICNDAISRKMLVLDLVGSWLAVYYRAPLNFSPEPEEYGQYIVCAMDITHMGTTGILRRIMFMLAERAKSCKQDVNGIMAENDLVRKEII